MFEFCSTGCSVLVAQAEPTVDVPFFESGLFIFGLLVVAVVGGWFLAKLITSGMRMGEYKGRMATVLISTLVASLMIWSKWPPQFGVDLRGGINMIGSLNLEAWRNSEDPNAPMPQAKDIIPELVQRVNPAGTKEIMIRPLGNDKIEVTIPSVDLEEADNIWERLVKAGKLEFRIVADLKYHKPQIDLARQMATAGGRDRNVEETDSSGKKKIVAYWVPLAREVVVGEQMDQDSPIKFLPQRSHLIRDKSTGRIIEYSEIASALGGEFEKQGRDFATWCKQHGIRTPQLLVIQPDADRNVEGKHLSSVSSDTDEKGRACVSFKTTDEGSRRLGMFTKMNEPDSQGNLRLMGIVLDDQLHSAPSIQEAIFKNGQISGSFTQEEVDELVINLRSGKLDVALNKAPISKDFVNSTLGEELKSKGLWAMVGSLALVLVFMAFYYRFAGVVAGIVLLLNVILVFALVMAIDQPLTLTGLAGLVLTVGMSVDANVLIFERIREEMDRGAALRMAIRNGFEKAMSTIVDSNVTTLLTAIVLYVIGTEQIKGFAVTLILGILMSMFTAVFVARLIFDIAERKRWLTSFNMLRIFNRQRFKFLNKIALTGGVSLAVIVIGMVAMFALGPKILDHDLRGGSTVRMVFTEAQDIEKIRDELASQSVPINGEKIEFAVTSFGTTAGNEAMKDRVFKVDSNLRAWEGAQSEEKFEQLDELLARVFAGRLMKHHVEVSGPPASNSSSNGSGSPDQAKQPEVGRLQWRTRPAVPSLSALVIAGSVGMVQDTGAGSTPMPPPTEVPAATGADGNATANSVEPTQSEPQNVIPNPGVPAPQQEKPPTSDPIPDVPGSPNKPAAGGDFADAAAVETNVKYVDVTRKLTVDPEISGKTLRSLIVDASLAAGLELDEDQVQPDSPDVLSDESPLSTVSKNWDVKLSVTNEADADRIISVWAEDFNKQPYFPTSSKVGGQIAKESQYVAFGALFASFLGIIAYVWVRFQNIAFGLAAVIALVHDVVIVLGSIALSHWLAGIFGFLGVVEFKISLEIVAAVLTVIGYSINDTIVVFDRIREVRGKRAEITADMIDQSISETLSRTTLTSFTTFIVVFILYCFGGEAIHGFAFAMCVGVVVGTYSSIFIASPCLLWLMNTVGLNPGHVDAATE